MYLMYNIISYYSVLLCWFPLPWPWPGLWRAGKGGDKEEHAWSCSLRMRGECCQSGQATQLCPATTKRLSDWQEESSHQPPLPSHPTLGSHSIIVSLRYLRFSSSPSWLSRPASDPQAVDQTLHFQGYLNFKLTVSTLGPDCFYKNKCPH